MTVQALLFDCDGVLVDTEPLSRQVLVAMLDELGIDSTLAGRLDSVSGQRLGDSLDEIARWTGRALPDDFHERYREREYALLAERVTAIPGIARALDALDLPRAVASNGPLEKMRITLGATGLWSRFDPHVYSAYEIDRHKPDPGLYLHAAAMLGTTPERCLVVEDSHTGARAGLAAGMRVAGFGPFADALAGLGAIPLRDMSRLPALVAQLAA